jgi:hypothetical protein
LVYKNLPAGTYYAWVENGSPVPGDEEAYGKPYTISVTGGVPYLGAKIKSPKKTICGKKPNPQVWLYGGHLRLYKGRDYKVYNYQNNRTAKIEFLNTYMNEYKSFSYRTTPKKMSIKKLKGSKKSATIIISKLPSYYKVTKHYVKYKIAGTNSWKTKSFSDLLSK